MTLSKRPRKVASFENKRRAGQAFSPRCYRKVLWVALALNAAMFVVELGASWTSSSASLMADPIDFFG